MRPMRRGRNRGIVLFISLALLLAMTFAGLATAMTTTLELRMARNDHDASFALHAAEAALLHAEDWLSRNVGDPANVFSGRGGGLHVAGAYRDVEPWRSTAWTDADSLEVDVAGVASQARYVIEWLDSWVDAGSTAAPLAPTRMDAFRITARGLGASGQATALVQCIYVRPRDGGSRPGSGRVAFVELR